MLTYITLLIVILLIGFWGEKSKNSIFALRIIMIILFLFYALRYGIGLDYFNYYTLIVERTPNLFLGEPLNDILIQIGYWLANNQFYFIATAFIFLAPLYKIWKVESNDKLLSILLFMSTDCLFGQSFSFVRQFAAIGIFILATPYLYEKKYIKYYLLCVCAMLFHKSAIIIFILPFLRWFLLNPRFPYWAVFSSFGYFLTYPFFLKRIQIYSLYILPEKYTVYLNSLNNNSSEGLKMFFLWSCLTVFSLWVYYLKKKNQFYEKRQLFFINIFFLSFFIYTVGLKIGFIPGSRASYYMLIYYTLAIPIILTKSKYRLLFKSIFFVISILSYFFSLWFINQISDGALIPYKTIFNQVPLNSL
ncbi:MAG: EpsG family protein [Bacteroidales bacterium]